MLGVDFIPCLVTGHCYFYTHVCFVYCPLILVVMEELVVKMMELVDEKLTLAGIGDGDEFIVSHRGGNGSPSIARPRNVYSFPNWSE